MMGIYLTIILTDEELENDDMFRDQVGDIDVLMTMLSKSNTKEMQ